MQVKELLRGNFTRPHLIPHKIPSKQRKAASGAYSKRNETFSALVPLVWSCPQDWTLRNLQPPGDRSGHVSGVTRDNVVVPGYIQSAGEAEKAAAATTMAPAGSHATQD